MLAPQGQSASAASVPFSPPPSRNEEDIRDIRSPRLLPSPWPWWAFAAGALALAGVVSAAWHWFQRGRRLVKLPFEIALDQLEQARRYMTPEQARDFCFAVSEIIRGYIEVRFNARAAHRTTEEFLHDLLEEKQDMLASQRASLADFLQHCDMAKFALWQFSIAEMEAMHTSARAFVLQSAVDPVAIENSKKTTLLPKSPRVHLDPAVPNPPHATAKPA